ncbi:hypothetical protein [uncultured Legionella sp.]|uniref:hypothetical protein n=1 Tax=uncultured Legionella sp. TaxID=210934 RepID=UPI00262FD0FB|nr:hypothetical protein [uncultured Legionella sp.]
MLRVRLGNHLTKNYREDGTAYHPDFIIYDIDETEYRTFWTNMSTTPRNRLYTDGVQVIQVSWWQSLVQSIKGWLGFENRCASDKIEMTLAKIAYHGYIKGFNSQQIKALMPSLISQRFESLITQPRNNQHSAELQYLLMSYYITRSDEIIPWYSCKPTISAFGQTFNREGQYQLIPSLDPQDNHVISKAINGLHYCNINLNTKERLKNSSFAQSYANHLTYQGNYTQALVWHESIRYEHQELFINFFLSQKHTLSNSLQLAVELMEYLFQSPKTEDKDKSVAYVRGLDKSEQLTHLSPHSTLKRKVADAYLQDAKIEKNKYAITKLFFGNNLIPLLAHAINLAPNILDNDQSMQDIVLKEEWTVYLFNEAIKNKRFMNARVLFESHPAFKFDKNNLNILKDNYLAELSAKQQRIRQLLKQGECTQAEITAKEAIAIARQIAIITPEENPLLTVTIDYAGILIEIDKIMCPDIKDASLERLDSAQKILTNCSLSKNSVTYKQHFNELLLRKIGCLIEKSRVPIDFNDNLSTRKEFLPTIQQWLALLQHNLSSFISLNKYKPTKEMRAVLGKMYYLKGDIILFFTRLETKALPYFQQAAEIMPENPYYRLRSYELANNEKRHSVRDEIDQMAFLNTTKYTMWMTERWNAEQFMSEGFDIHSIEPQEPGFLASLSGMF